MVNVQKGFTVESVRLLFSRLATVTKQITISVARGSEVRKPGSVKCVNV